MTHYEDVKRVATNETIDYLNARIQALEKRVQYLEAIIEVEYLNKQQ
jgi:polyhydroxyalkanoate synthesis regulator phasin